MRNYLVEFIGTFFLVFVICFSGGEYLAPIAIGAVLMVMIYMGGHISGAHYNPAVTLAVLIRGKIGVKDSIIYMIVQIAGAFAAALLFNLVWGRSIGGPKPAGDINILKPLAMEMIMTFALALVVLSVATSKKTAGNHYYGLAIGCTVLAGAITVGGMSGGAFNPAVGIGPTVMNAVFAKGSFNDLWLYIVGPCTGAVIAALMFKMMNPEEK